MPKLSYSALQTFHTCPLQYKYAYVDKLPSEQNAMMHFGTLLHQVMQELYTSTLLPLSKEELTDIFTSKWKQQWCQGNTTQAKQEFAEALAIIEREWHKREASSAVHTIGLEKSFLFPVNSSFDIKGRIDRVDKVDDQTLEIIDYKTGRSVPSQADLENNLQLAVYYLAVHALWPAIERTTLTLHYLRPDTTISFTPDSSFKAQAESRLHAIVEALKISDFTPQAGNHCVHCSYRHICPLMKDMSMTLPEKVL